MFILRWILLWRGSLFGDGVRYRRESCEEGSEMYAWYCGKRSCSDEIGMVVLKNFRFRKFWCRQRKK
jgi:hypothetical protein